MLTPEQMVKKILDYLEARIDPAHYDAVSKLHRSSLDYLPVERLPLTLYIPYEGQTFTPYPVAEAADHPAKMMVNELLQGFTSIYHLVDLGTDTPLCLRPNLGVTIIASMFGATIEYQGEQPPWVHSLDSLDRIREAVESPIPDVMSGLVPRAIEQYAFYQDALENYPKCKAAFQITLPDLQGPFDNAELLWGSSIFLGIYDEPELLNAFMSKITETTLAVYSRLIQEVREDIRPNYQFQHAVGVKGKLLIRSDTSVIMLSPASYTEHVMPHDVRLAEQLDGVALHFCGNGSQQIDNLMTMPGLETIDFGQSFMMDIDTIYAKAQARKLPLTRVQFPEVTLIAEQMQQRFPTGVSLVRSVESVSEAQHVWQTYIGENH